MHTVELLNHLVRDHQILAYAVLFVGILLEGEIVVIATGVLAHLGAMDFWIALVFVLAGGMIKTFFGYYFGEFLNRKYHDKKFFKYVERRVLYFIPRFKKSPFWAIFISKFIMSMNYMVIIFAGYEKVNFRTYLRAEILSTIIWAPLMLSLGYYFSLTAVSITKEISKFSLIIVLFVLTFMFVDKFVAKVYAIYEDFKSNRNNLNGDK